MSMSDPTPILLCIYIYIPLSLYIYIYIYMLYINGLPVLPIIRTYCENAGPVTASSEWPQISSLSCCPFVVLVLTVLHTGTELYRFSCFVKTIIYSCLYHHCYQASRSDGCHWAGGSRVQMFRRPTFLIQFCSGFPDLTWQYLSYITTSCYHTSNSLFI